MARHGLSRPHLDHPADVVRWLGAVQAQDWPAAKWSVGMRMKHATDAVVQGALDAGVILRTHVLRPTWHLVVPEDIRWMLELTAPRVRKHMAPYDRRLEIDATLLRKSSRVIADALRGGAHLTRQEIKQRLAGVGVVTDVQRLAHIVMQSELDGLICSGTSRGKQLTYALLDERVPSAPTKTRDDALRELCLRYFRSHGPAQLKDFAWWSGLTMEDARAALEMNDRALEEAVVRGRSYRWVAGGRTPPPPAAFLASIFDEYTIAYTDRSDLNSEGRDVETLISWGNALTAVIVLDGKVAGGWKRTLTKKRLTIDVRPFRKLSAGARAALTGQAGRMGAFLGIDAEVRFGRPGTKPSTLRKPQPRAS